MAKALASLVICAGLFSFASEHQSCQPLTPTAVTPFDSCTYLPFGNGIRPPKIVRDHAPDFSEIASKTSLQTGSVALALAFNENGTIEAVKVVHSSDSRLEPTAIDTVRQWVFTPAMRDGKPVAVQMNVETSFQH
jgi:TonB family protein